MRETLDSEALREALVTPGSPWQSLDVHPELGSTNAEAAQAGRLWHVVVADHQQAGRGRLGRTWEAPLGASVAVSAVLPAPPDHGGWVPLLTGLAVSRALSEVAGVQAGLKWPNDVLVAEDGWRKVCGVLCELHPVGVVVGIGINVDQRREELPVDTATSLRLCGVPGVRREQLIPAVLDPALVDHVVTVSDDDAISTARKLARSQGCLVGTSAGANVWAAIHIACEKTKGNIVTVLPDRAERYFSTALI
jgi:BirA family biotin operon repressor/biotin-[acetyl-CoA-carboxylase] ligase